MLDYLLLEVTHFGPKVRRQLVGLRRVQQSKEVGVRFGYNNAAGDDILIKVGKLERADNVALWCHYNKAKCSSLHA